MPDLVSYILTSVKQLTALHYGAYQVEGWASFDLMPKGATASTFDAVQLGSFVYISVAFQSTIDFCHDLYCCVLDLAEDGFSFEKYTETGELAEVFA